MNDLYAERQLISGGEGELLILLLLGWLLVDAMLHMLPENIGIRCCIQLPVARAYAYCRMQHHGSRRIRLGRLLAAGICMTCLGTNPQLS